MGLNELEESVIRAIASKKLIEQEYNQAQVEIKKWRLIAQQALKKGREDLAREALIRKNFHTQKTNTLKAQLEEVTLKINNLQRKLSSPGVPLPINKPPERLEEREEKIIPTEVASHEEAKPNFIEEAIRETQEAANSAVVAKERIQEQYERAEKEANDWGKKTQLALQKDDENLVFEAFISKKIQSQLAATLKIQIEQQNATIELLERNLKGLKNIRDLLEMEAAVDFEQEWERELTKTLEAQRLIAAGDRDTSSSDLPSDNVIDAEFE